jgi:hypothetical protein
VTDTDPFILDQASSLEAVADEDLADAAQRALSGPSETTAPPEIVEPTDGQVTLPGGFRRVTMGETGPQFVEVTKAWVRELNGEDEERIARSRMKEDNTAFFQTILERGVEKLGDDVPTKDDLASLLVGDREYLLMEIARATYGDEIEYVDVPCPMCGDPFDISLSISDDIPVKRLDDPSDRAFEVRLRKGVASVTLPTGDVTQDMAKAETPAEANTALIANAVIEIRREGGETIAIQGDKEAAKRLGLRDRQTLVNEMAKRMPGPQYNEVKFNHEPGCGEEIRLPLQLADLFRGL